MVHSEGRFNLFLGKYRGNKCTATSINMFIPRNTYEVTILAYFKQIGLEKYRGGPSHSSYSRANTTAMKKEINTSVEEGRHTYYECLNSEGNILLASQ